MIFRLNSTALDKTYLASRPYQAIPIAADFFNLIVNKPWGNEYLLYKSPAIEIWNLFIGCNRATSMHCHPNKKTSLVVLDGKVIFSSLNESMELSPMDAVIIDPGVFHQTQAVSKRGVKVFEFETPPMKHDLVRLEDKYGRTNEGYEGLEKMIIDNNRIRFGADDINVVKNLDNSQICIRRIKNANDRPFLNCRENSLSVILDGSIASEYGDTLYKPADILLAGELNDCSGFICQNLELLTIEPDGK